MAPVKQQDDTRPLQAARVADFLEKHPASTQKEIDAVCDTGCISKVLSDMERIDLYGMGYGLARDWREVPCAGGTRAAIQRRNRTQSKQRRNRAQSK